MKLFSSQIRKRKLKQLYLSQNKNAKIWSNTENVIMRCKIACSVNTLVIAENSLETEIFVVKLKKISVYIEIIQLYS